jgi:hypothetical protein
MYVTWSSPSGRSRGIVPEIFWVRKTVPGARSWAGKSGSVQPTQGTPARGFEFWRFQRMRLQGEWVRGPRQPRS